MGRTVTIGALALAAAALGGAALAAGASAPSSAAQASDCRAKGGVVQSGCRCSAPTTRAARCSPAR
jgi:hypothetical protein